MIEELVEVDALADEPVAVEDEVRAHAAAKRAAGGRERAQRAEVRAEQVELDDHRVVGVVQRDELVALVGERAAALGEVGAHRLLAVVDVAGRDELVARVPERRRSWCRSRARSPTPCARARPPRGARGARRWPCAHPNRRRQDRCGPGACGEGTTGPASRAGARASRPPTVITVLPTMLVRVCAAIQRRDGHARRPHGVAREAVDHDVVAGAAVEVSARGRRSGRRRPRRRAACRRRRRRSARRRRRRRRAVSSAESAASAGGVDHVVAGQRVDRHRSLPAIAPVTETRAARPLTCALGPVPADASRRRRRSWRWR